MTCWCYEKSKFCAFSSGIKCTLKRCIEDRSKAIQNNDVIDVIYDSICGYPLEEAYRILTEHRQGKYIPISFIKDCITKGDDWTFDKDTLWHLIERWENNVAKI